MRLLGADLTTLLVSTQHIAHLGIDQVRGVPTHHRQLLAERIRWFGLTNQC